MGLTVNLREDLNALTPRLRRYARALMSGHPGGCERADDLVHATLLRALGSRNLGTNADLVIRLYATLTQMNRDVVVDKGGQRATAMGFGRGLPGPAPGTVRQSKLTAGLMSLALDDREALLLVALENFNYDEAARILHVSRLALLGRLTRARHALDRQLRPVPGLRDSLPAERDRPAPYLRLVK